MPPPSLTPEEKLAAAGAVDIPVIEKRPKRPLYPFEFPDEIKLPRLAWLLPGFLPAFGTGFLYGPPGSMKTFFAIDLACRLASGMDVLGLAPAYRGGVIYVAAEDPDGVRLRIEAWKRHHGVTERFPLALVPSAPHLGDPASMERLTETIAAVAKAMEATTGVSPRLVIVDTLSRVSPGMRGNEDGDATAQVAALNALASAVSGCCLALHHPGKDRERGMRGSSVYQANGDFVFEMEIHSHEKTAAILTIKKLKNAAAGKHYGIGLSAPLKVGKDASGALVTSCVCVEAELSKVNPTMKRLPEGLEIMFLGIRGAMDMVGSPTRAPRLEYTSPSVARPALNDHLVSRDLLATETPAGNDASNIRMAITNAARNKLQKALEKLRHRGLIDFDSQRVWLTRQGERYEALSRGGIEAR